MQVDGVRKKDLSSSCEMGRWQNGAEGGWGGIIDGLFTLHCMVVAHTEMHNTLLNTGLGAGV